MSRQEISTIEKRIDELNQELVGLEQMFSPGAGFGCPHEESNTLSRIKFLRAEKSELQQQLNHMSSNKTPKSSARASWIAAIATVSLAVVAILTYFHPTH